MSLASSAMAASEAGPPPLPVLGHSQASPHQLPVFGLQSSHFSATKGGFAGLAQPTASSSQTGKSGLWHALNLHLNGAAGSSTSSSDSLNLGSASQLFSARALGNFSSLTVDIGGKSKVIGVNSMLTAAELAAAAEVLDPSVGKQTIVINSAGIASGGSLILDKAALATIDGALGGSIDSLTVPKHITLADQLTSFNLSGTLTNAGTILAQGGTAGGAFSSTNSGASAGPVTQTISASSINNSGTISAAAKGEGLTLASSGLTNSGLIKTDGNLIINVPNVSNSGTVRSAAGDVNFTSSEALTLNNTGGTVQAAGNINFRDGSYAGGNPIAITGGNLLSQQLNLNAGTGVVQVSGANVSGVVNTNAGVAQVFTDSANLRVGNSDVSGDPLFVNQGNIIIEGNQIGPQNGANLSFVAGGNILSGGGTLDTSSAGGSGGQLNLIAGADFTVSTQSNQLTIADLHGGSSTGGFIDLTGKNGGTAPITGITTAATGPDATQLYSGGAVTMVAFAGSTKGTGTVSIPSSVTINASGADTSSGGNVTIIAGAAGGNAISIGGINASGGQNLSQSSNNGAVITLASAMPVISSGTTVSSSTGLSAPIGMNATLAGNIVTGNLQSSSGTVNISTLGNLSFGTIDVSGYGGNTTSQVGSVGGYVNVSATNITGNNVYAYGGGGAGGASDQNGFSGGAGGTASLLTLTATGSVALTGQINVSGGGGGGGGGQDSNQNGSAGTGGDGGFGGQVFVSTIGNITVNGGILALDGGAGGSGTATSSPGAASGNGGGGGGALGGGGGGGAAGAITNGLTVIAGSGGGGGGGLYGGGGGGSQTVQGSSIALTGGGGAGFASGGLAGSGDINGTAGIVLSAGSGPASSVGGNGAAAAPGTGGLGGVFALGGGGGANAGSSTGGAGIAALLNGVVQDSGNAEVSLTSTAGNIGTAKAPMEIVNYQNDIEAKTAYLNLPGSGSTSASVSAVALTTGQGSLITFSNESDSAPSNPSGNLTLLGATVGVTGTLQVANSGNSFTVAGPVTGGQTINLFSNQFASYDSANLIVNSNVSTQGPAGVLSFISSGTITGKGNVSGYGVVSINSIGPLSWTGNINSLGSTGGIQIGSNQTASFKGNLSSTGQTGILVSVGDALSVTGNITTAGQGGDINLTSTQGSISVTGNQTATSQGYVTDGAFGALFVKGNVTTVNNSVNLGSTQSTVTYSGTVTAGGTGYIRLNAAGDLTESGALVTAGSAGTISILSNTGLISASGIINAPLSSVLISANNGAIDLNKTTVTAGGSPNGKPSGAGISIMALQGITASGTLTANLGSIGLSDSLAGISFNGVISAPQSTVSIQAFRDTVSLAGSISAGGTPPGPAAVISIVGEAVNSTANMATTGIDAGINVNSLNGALTLAGTISAAAGEVNLTANSGAAIVNKATISAGGGSGGTPNIGISLSSGAGLTVTGTNISSTGPGTVMISSMSGLLSFQGNISASSNEVEVQNGTGNVIITGNITSGAASGTAVSLSALGSLAVTGAISATGASGGISMISDLSNIVLGGSFTAQQGSIAVNSGAQLNINGTTSTGGMVAFFAFGALVSSGSISGGSVGLISNGSSMSISGNVSGASGVAITAISEPLNINKANIATSGAGGNISVVDSQGALSESGTLKTTGVGANISIIAANGLLTANGTISTTGVGSDISIGSSGPAGNMTLGGIVSTANTGSSISITSAGSLVSTANLSATGVNGAVTMGGVMGLSSKGTIEANQYVNLSAVSPGALLTVAGNVSAASTANGDGYIIITGGNGAISLNGTLTAAGIESAGVGVLLQSAGPVLQAKGASINAQSVELRVAAAGTSTAPLQVNTPSLQLTAPSTSNAFVTDTNTASTTVLMSGNLGNVSLSSAASTLNLATGATAANLNNGTFVDTNKTGNLDASMLASSLTSNTALVFSTAGNITSSSPNLVVQGTLTLSSKGGSIGFSPLTPFEVVGGDPTITSTTSGSGNVWLNNGTGNITLQTVSAPGAILVQANLIGVQGSVISTGKNGSVVLLAATDIYPGTATSLVSGNTVELTAASGDIGSSQQFLNINASGTLAISGTGPSSSAYLNAINGLVNFAAGTYAMPGTLAISNAGGSLTLGGSGTLVGAPAEIDLSAQNNLTVSANLAAQAPLGAFSMIAGGALTLPTGTLTVGSPNSQNGGMLTVRAAAIAFSGSVLTLNANAVANTDGSGGTINFDITGKQNLAISTGTGGNLVFNAAGTLTGGTGGSGGTVDVRSGGNLTVDQSGLTIAPAATGGGTGGNLSLSAAGTLTTTSALSTAGDGAAAGGNIYLASNGNLTVGSGFNLDTGNGGNVTVISAANLSIGGTISTATGNVALFANGAKAFIVGGPGANGITGAITAANLQVSNPSGITVSSALSVPGALEFDTTLLTNTAGLSGESSFTVNSGTGSLAIAGASTSWGAPSSVTLLSGGTLTTGPLFTGTIFTSPGLPGVIDIAAAGALTFGFSTLQVLGSGPPASITIVGSSYTTPTGQALSLIASGTTGIPGYEGNISFTETGKSTLNIGAGNLVLNVSPGGIVLPVAGSIFVSSGGALVVDSSAITTSSAPGVNTNLTLVSAANLQVNGLTQALVGTGADLLFQSDSKTAFTIGSTAQANGIQFTGVLAGNNISIINSKGNIGLDTTPGSAVNLNASGLSLIAGGSVNVTDTAAGAVVLGAASAGTAFILNDTSSSALLSQTAGTSIAAKALTLNFGGTSGTISTNATTVGGAVSGANADWSVTDTATTAVSLGAVNAANGVSFLTAGPLNIGGAITGADVILVAGGSIIAAAAVGSATGVTSLSASSGSITTSGTGALNGQTLSVQAGAGGLGGKSALIIDSGAVVISTSGLVNVNDKAATATVQTLATPVASFTFADSGALTIGGVVTTAGGINVSAGALTVSGGSTISAANALSLTATTGALTLNAGSAVFAQAGNITLTGVGISNDSTNQITAITGSIAINSSGAGAVGINGAWIASGAITGTFSGSGPVSLNGSMFGSAITINESGAGQVTVNSQAKLSAATGITINAGKNALVIDPNAWLLTTGKGAISLSGTGISSGSNNFNTADGNISLNNTGSGSVLLEGSYIASNGNFILQSTGTGTISIGAAGTGVDITANAVSITSTGAGGNVALTNAAVAAINGAITINAGANSLSLTGSTLSEAGGSAKNQGISLTGVGVSTDSASAVSANTGGIALANSGAAALSLSGTAISAPSGSFVLTNAGSGDVSILASANIGAQSISISDSGASSALTLSGSTLSASAGAVVVNAGNNGVSLTGMKFSAGGGSKTNEGISVTGAGIVDIASTMTAGSGNITETSSGSNMYLSSGSTYTASKGTFTATETGAGAVNFTAPVIVATAITVADSAAGSSFLGGGGTLTATNGGINFNEGSNSYSEFGMAINSNLGTAKNQGISITAGDVSIGGIYTAASGGVTVTSSGAKGLTVGASGQLIAQGNFAVDLTSTGAGGITVNGQVVGASATLTATENTAGNAITLAGAALTTSNGPLTLNSGNNPLSITATNLSAGGGNIAITGSNMSGDNASTIANKSGGITIVNQSGTMNLSSTLTASNGSLSITDNGSGTLKASGAMTVNNGNLTIADTNAAGSIDIGLAAATSMQINNGNAVIQNINTSGSITLEGGTIIHGSATALNQGNVTVALGTLLTSKQLTAQGLPAPANVTYAFTPGGTILFATGGPAPAFVSAGNVLNAFGRAITLSAVPGSTGKINFEGNVTITADPPIAAAAAALPAQSLGLVGAASVAGQTAGSAPVILSPAAGVNNTNNFAVLNFPTLNVAPINNGSANIGFNSGVTSNAAAGITNLDITDLGITNLGATNLDTTNLGATNLDITNLGATTGTALDEGDRLHSVYVQSAQPERAVVEPDKLLDLKIPGARISRSLSGGVSEQHQRASTNSAYKVVSRQLNDGALLIASEQAQEIVTPLGTITLAKNALALVIADAASVSIYNLDDTRKDSIVLRSGKERISLSPGRHVTLTSRSKKSFAEINPIKTVGYRSLRSRSLNNVLQLHSAEFSLASAISTIKPIGQLISASDTADRRVGEHLIKTAAILEALSSQVTPYQLMALPETTAMR
jgi:hypothetical protein